MTQAVFKDGQIYAKASGLWQWDYGQILYVYGLTFEKAEVHFALSGKKEAFIVPALIQKDVLEAKIPDDLLEQGWEIHAYIYVADTQHGETVRTVSIPVTPRPKPEDYDSPGEKNLLRQMMDRLDKKADNLQLSDGALQLLSGENEIGEKIRLPTGGSGVESITNTEIDEIMEGE